MFKTVVEGPGRIYNNRVNKRVYGIRNEWTGAVEYYENH